MSRATVGADVDRSGFGSGRPFVALEVDADGVRVTVMIRASAAEGLADQLRDAAELARAEAGKS